MISRLILVSRAILIFTLEKYLSSCIVAYRNSDGLPVCLKPLCGNASFISRSSRDHEESHDRRKKERSHRDTFSLVLSLSLPLFLVLSARSVPLALGYVSVAVRTADLSTLCSAAQKRRVFFDLSRPPSLQAPLLALFPYRCPALLRVLPQRSFLALSLTLCIFHFYFYYYTTTTTCFSSSSSSSTSS